MAIFDSKKRSQIPIFVSLFLSAVILISIFLSAYMIVMSSAHKIIQSQMEDAKTANFQSIINKITNTFSNAESLAYKVSASNIVTDYAKSTQRDHYTDYEIRKFLTNLVAGYEDIKACYIYLPQYDYILSSTIGLDSRSFFRRYYQNSYEDWMESLHSNKNTLITRPLDSSRDRPDIQESAVINTISKQTDTEFPAVVVVQVNRETLSRKIKALCFEESDEVLAYDDTGIFLSTLEDGTGSQNLYEEALHHSGAGSFTWKTETDAYTVQPAILSRYQFTAVYASDRNGTIRKIGGKQHMEYFIVGLALALALGYGAYFAQQHTRQIKKILNILNTESIKQKADCIKKSKNRSLASREIPKNEYAAIEMLVRNHISSYMDLAREYDRKTIALSELYLEKLLTGKKDGSSAVPDYINFYGNSYAVILYTPDSVLSNQEMQTARAVLKESVYHLLLPEEGCYTVATDGNLLLILNFIDSVFRSKEGSLEDFADETLDILNSLQGTVYSVFLSEACSGVNHLYSTCQQVLKNASGHEQGDNENIPAWINRCYQIIEEHYQDDNFSTSFIADELQMTRSYLSTCFKQKTGNGLYEQIQKRRIAAAREIIRNEPDVLISNAACRTGFNSTASFIRTFKKYEGITPGQWKENLS